MKSHRTLAAWQEAHAVVRGTFALSRDHWHPAGSAYYHQLHRAALSVQLNIAEGYAVGGRRTFLRHLRIAYGSAVEAGEVLELLATSAIVPQAEVTPLIQRNARCRGLLLGLLRKLRLE